MQVVQKIREMQAISRAVRGGRETLGLVPTMGALHEGHLSLVRAARARCSRVVATIFVNPLQFGPNEDFARYPRTFDEDCAKLEQAGVDWLFAPAPEEMYPAGAGTIVDVPEVGGRLDGASRPGHFRGVTTVVAKLFHITGPHCAFFGQKDAAQVAVLGRMVRDLNFDLELVVCPTVREGDGVAMSSRNRYLSAEERVRARALSRALRAAESVAKGWQVSESASQRVGESAGPHVSCSERLREVMLRELADVRVDYAEVVDPETLEPVEDVCEGALLAVAAWVGETRLIDNLRLEGRR